VSKKMTPALAAQRKRLAYTAAKREFAAHRYVNMTSGVQEIIRRADAAEMAAWRSYCNAYYTTWPWHPDAYYKAPAGWCATLARR
jgi:hypothetical protein